MIDHSMDGFAPLIIPLLISYRRSAIVRIHYLMWSGGKGFNPSFTGSVSSRGTGPEKS